MNDDLSRFKDLYFETAKEQVLVLKDNLAEFTNTENKAITDKIFIAAHSIKGQSLMMGYERVGHAAKLIEKTFRNLKDGVIQKNEVNLNLINNTVEKIGLWLDTHDAANLEPDLGEEISELEKSLV